MPKLKTHRGAAKRFKKTGTGKFKDMKRGRRHLLTAKTKKRKNHLRTPAGIIDHTQQHQIEAMLPYA